MIAAASSSIEAASSPVVARTAGGQLPCAALDVQSRELCLSIIVKRPPPSRRPLHLDRTLLPRAVLLPVRCFRKERRWFGEIQSHAKRRRNRSTHSPFQNHKTRCPRRAPRRRQPVLLTLPRVDICKFATVHNCPLVAQSPLLPLVACSCSYFLNFDWLESRFHGSTRSDLDRRVSF